MEVTQNVGQCFKGELGMKEVNMQLMLTADVLGRFDLIPLLIRKQT